MGKLTVETCDIEGLKVLTPQVLEIQEDILWRLTAKEILLKLE